MLPNEIKIKTLLEEILIPHQVREGSIRITYYRIFTACLGLDDNLKKKAVWDSVDAVDALAFVTYLSGFAMRFESGNPNWWAYGKTREIKTKKDEPPSTCSASAG